MKKQLNNLYVTHTGQPLDIIGQYTAYPPTPMDIHTDIHIAYTHPYIHTHTNIYIAYTYIHTRIYIYTHIRTYILHTHTHTWTYTHTHRHTHTDIYIHTHIHIHTYTLSQLDVKNTWVYASNINIYHDFNCPHCSVG